MWRIFGIARMIRIVRFVHVSEAIIYLMIPLKRALVAIIVAKKININEQIVGMLLFIPCTFGYAPKPVCLWLGTYAGAIDCL